MCCRKSKVLRQIIYLKNYLHLYYLQSTTREINTKIYLKNYLHLGLKTSENLSISVIATCCQTEISFQTKLVIAIIKKKNNYTIFH